MSLSDERRLILNMLESGKITSEDAIKLLEALENGTKQNTNEGSNRQQKSSNYQDEIFKVRERINDWKKEFKSNCNQKDFDRMVDDFVGKAEKVGKNVAVTTFGIVDKMIDFVGSFVDTNSFNVFGSYKMEERNFEAVAANGIDIFVEGINGHIIVKKHLDDKILIRSKVRSPQENADSILMFSDSGSAVNLTLNKAGNISVSHEIFLPASKFGSVRFETSNGKIYVEDCLAESFESITRNGHVELMGVNSDRISVNTRNAKIQISYVMGKEIDINTNNAVIDIKHIKSQVIKAVTTNGRILVENLQNQEGCSEVSMFLKNSNGGMKVNMNDMDNRGYKVKARTSNGPINILIPEMTYHNVNRAGAGSNLVEAESGDYQNFGQRVLINAETTNGYIEIVK